MIFKKQMKRIEEDVDRLEKEHIEHIAKKTPTTYTRNVRLFSETGQGFDTSVTWESEDEEKGFTKVCNETILYGAHIVNLDMHIRVSKITWKKEEEN